MSALDLSMPKVLDLTVKNNALNSNCSVPNPSYYNKKHNNFDSNYSKISEESSKESQILQAHVIKDKIEEVKEEAIEINSIYEENNPHINKQQLEVKEDTFIKGNGSINSVLLQHQILEVKIANSGHHDVQLETSHMSNFAAIGDQQVKEEPVLANEESFSKAPHEIPIDNLNSWQSYWNGNRGFPQNQITNGLDQDIKPDLGMEHLYSYGQQQFNGSFMPNQFIQQSAQNLAQHNPYLNYFNPSLNAQSYYNYSMWNGYLNQFQHTQNPYGHQNILWGNSVKTELGISNEATSEQNPHGQQNIPVENAVKMELDSSNEATSDLGSSFDDSSENSFNSVDGIIDIKPTTDFKTSEEFVWVPDEKILPKGWKKRIYKSGKIPHLIIFKSPSNKRFSSKSAVVEYMDKFPLLYTKEDKVKLSVRSSRSTEVPYEWIPDEELLPKGWKKKVNKEGKPISGHYFFLSPTNQNFHSKTALLEYMNKNPHLFSEHDIYKLKSSMHTGQMKEYTNWENTDPTLPKGWFKRYCEYRARNPANTRLYRDFQYLSPQQEIFQSRNAVIAHMLANSYSEDDIKLFHSGKMSGRGQGKVPGRKPGVSYKQNYCSISVRDYTQWDDSDKTLPEGWLKRYSIYQDPQGRNHKEYQYLSPCQNKFTSRNTVLDFMKKSGKYSESEIEKVQSGKMSGRIPGKKRGPKPGNLNGESDSVRDFTKWDDSDPTLPKGWFKRYSIYCDPNGRKHKEYQYLSPNQTKFTTRKAVLHYMRQSGQYSEDDIELVISGKMTGKVRGNYPDSKTGVSVSAD